MEYETGPYQNIIQAGMTQQM